MTTPSTDLAPSLDDIETLSRRAFGDLPGHFRRLTGDVVFRIEDYADEQVLEEMQIEDPLELTGLYIGVDLTTAGEPATGQEPPMVFLFRMPILFEWAERGDVTLFELVTHILVHEIGHHFGLSDDDMDAILGEGA